MPNNMQPHLFVFIALYSEAEIVVCTLWVACFCQCSFNKQHYRKKKTHKRLHNPTTRVSGFMWDGWQRQVTFPQLTIFLSTLLLFYPLQLYLNQILNQTSPYLHINFKVQTAKIRQQKGTTGSEIHDSESYASVIH